MLTKESSSERIFGYNEKRTEYKKYQYFLKCRIIIAYGMTVSILGSVPRYFNAVRD
jgi:rRNA processing protein Krr1/Pno1